MYIYIFFKIRCGAFYLDGFLTFINCYIFLLLYWHVILLFFPFYFKNKYKLDFINEY